MFDILLLTATFLTATVMAQALAHALEMPGKMRLTRDQYHAVQTIYYPGFTIGGMAEPLAILVTTAALAVQPADNEPFRLIIGALAALVLTHILFWVVVQPVNRHWLHSIEMTDAAEKFFHTSPKDEASVNWTRLRKRWEWGHAARAATSTVAFVLLLVAVASG